MNIGEILRSRPVRALIGITCGTIMLANCSDDKADTVSNKPQCDAIQPQDWSRPPRQLNPEAARKLGVKPAALDEAVIGGVACKQSYTTEQFTEGVLVDVPGISDKCMLIGALSRSQTPPQPGQSFNELLAVCVDPASK